MSDGRTLVYPTEFIGFGARPLSVPNRGNVLCASGFFPFRLADSERVTPGEWYQAISKYGGEMVLPDSMAPLPGAELVTLGVIPPVTGKTRKARLRCGSIQKEMILYPDPNAPDKPFLADPSTAVWHKTENPEGRGGGGEENPNREKPPLIVSAASKKTPIWLGQTPFVHPSRVQLAGTPDEQTGSGWGADSDASVLYEANKAFWAESLQPGEPLEYEGLSKEPVETTLPRYRLVIVQGRADGSWVSTRTRIHSVMLIPAAGLCAIVWRTGIDLEPTDPLGESVFALVAALKDADAEDEDPEELGYLAAQRWTEPANFLDDRPLLPPALAATLPAPFATPEDDTAAGRYEASKEWAEGEIGISQEDNPFGNSGLPEEAELGGEIEKLLENEDAPPDINKVDELANSVLAASKKRHEEDGFKEPEDLEAPREPEIREEALEPEVETRLQTPYSSVRERDLEKHTSETGSADLDSGELLVKMNDARLTSPSPVLFWPALNEEEGAEFGQQLVDKLAEEDLEYHIDISAVIVDGTKYKARIVGRRFDGTLAEESVWRNVYFSECEFVSCTFAKSQFDNCTFQSCTFRETNLSSANTTNSRLISCTLEKMNVQDPTYVDCSFEECTLTDSTYMEAGFHRVKFLGGNWQKLQFMESLFLETQINTLDLAEVTFTATAIVVSKLEHLKMYKVWTMGKGYPGCTFTDVRAETCGFVGGCHFDEAQLSETFFVETGFTLASFKDTQIATGCQFSKCDFSLTVFENTLLEGVRFLRCSFATSSWEKVKASGAWFFESIVRGIDFKDTELARAVFADADIEGAEFQPDKTIGTDFRGTLKSSDS